MYGSHDMRDTQVFRRLTMVNGIPDREMGRHSIRTK